MTKGHQISDPKDALNFVLGGNAIFTVKSLKSGDHLTYKVRTPRKVKPNGPSHFVSVRTGGEDGNWGYLGCLYDGKRFAHGRKSSFKADEPQTRAFQWVTNHLFNKALPPRCEIWHEGTCSRCGRPLTDPESIVRGLGPECATKVNKFICE